MANGEEDLREKNKDTKKKYKIGQNTQWSNYHGREDAEMLQEKTNGWSASKNNRGDYDWDED